MQLPQTLLNLLGSWIHPHRLVYFRLTGLLGLLSHVWVSRNSQPVSFCWDFFPLPALLNRTPNCPSNLLGPLLNRRDPCELLAQWNWIKLWPHRLPLHVGFPTQFVNISIALKISWIRDGSSSVSSLSPSQLLFFSTLWTFLYFPVGQESR